MLLLVALAAGLAASGCGKDDKVVAGGPSGVPTYRSPSSPQNVLTNMVTAYQARDTTHTSLVYDGAYEGRSTDLASPAPAMLTFTKADEVNHVRKMSENPNIAAIVLDFGPTSTWLRLPPEPSDPPAWAVLQIDRALIQIQDVDTGALYQARPTIMMYTFAPTVSAPGDTTWKIVRWTEVKN